MIIIAALMVFFGVVTWAIIDGVEAYLGPILLASGTCMMALAVWLAVFRRIPVLLSLLVFVSGVGANILLGIGLADAYETSTGELWVIRENGEHFVQNNWAITVETTGGPLVIGPSLSGAIASVWYYAQPIGILVVFSSFFFYSLFRIERSHVKRCVLSTFIISA